MTHIHNEMPAQHVHDNGLAHDHTTAHAHAKSDGDHRAMTVALNGKPAPDKAPHASDGQCCGLTCISALPATLVDIIKPPAPTALCDVEGDRKVSDNAPPTHYRPPIS